MTYMKAIIGGLTAGLTALGTALLADGVTPVELVGIAGAVLVTFGTVYAAPKNAESSSQ